ncbi:hypothetical protein X975_21911, partial [Stegodyphus mimosarum]
MPCIFLHGSHFTIKRFFIANTFELFLGEKSFLRWIAESHSLFKSLFLGKENTHIFGSVGPLLYN